MSELDKKQEAILSAWKAGLTVTGFNGGDLGMIHAMQNAVTGLNAPFIGAALSDSDYEIAGQLLAGGVILVARDLASAHMGYPYLDDCEKSMKEKANV